MRFLNDIAFEIYKNQIEFMKEKNLIKKLLIDRMYIYGTHNIINL